jgi:hypothetical protein
MLALSIVKLTSLEPQTNSKPNMTPSSVVSQSARNAGSVESAVEAV